MSNISFRVAASVEVVATAIAETITTQLQSGKRVLWLVSGGSAIDVAVAVSQKIAAVDLQNLTVTLADERFGPIGHSDSNWFKLQKAGFALAGATMLPVLSNSDLITSSRQFANTLERVFRESDYHLGLLGIGSDGHTAGILPATEAITAAGFATGYVTEQFKRLTMTREAIAKLDEVVVYAVGESKRQVLESLQQDIPISEQPAQLLKTVPKVTIYNDQIGEPI